MMQFLGPKNKLFLVPGGTGKDKCLVWKMSVRNDHPPSRTEWASEKTVRQELEAILRKE